jgi:hypothetical protein
MDSILNALIDALDKQLDTLRPYTRQEFKAMIEPALAGLDETMKKLAFDYERSPYIEKRGIADGRKIVSSVPPDAFPDPVLYLFTCLQRVETYLYEKERSPGGGAGGPAAVESDAEEQRTLMYRSGVYKVIKTLASFLPDCPREVWKFRRKTLNAIEDQLWMMMTAGDAVIKSRDELTLLADILLALPPSEMMEFTSADQIADWFIEEGGEPAKRLAL